VLRDRWGERLRCRDDEIEGKIGTISVESI
jgi:hypothetical protein